MISCGQKLINKPATASRSVIFRAGLGVGTSVQHQSRSQSYVVVKAAPAEKEETNIKLFYRSGWSYAHLHGSINSGPWTDFPLTKVPSAPGKWLAGSIQWPEQSQDVEFVVANANKDSWDKPKAGGNYRISQAGNYTLQDGAVHAVEGRPVMVVSDLDGTMVGDDGATQEFKSFWEESGVTRGGVLVYNTGRALESFLELMQDKAHCLAHPDALISAVGTKVYEFDGSSWQEDKGWSGLLDGEAWSIKVAREAGYKALALVGKDKMHFRPANEQNEHKMTCGVHVEVLELVLSTISVELDGGGVKANIITSGHGDWKYLDIVPINAGKLEALEYVRMRHGFPTGSTVACGDSGNDILMLAGLNPAIVVGNAQPDLKNWVEERRKIEPPPADGIAERLFVASRFEARGILEGLERLGFK